MSVTKEVLGYTKALSIKLQGRYVDAVKAYRDVSLVKDTLASSRANVDQFHSRVYKNALDLAKGGFTIHANASLCGGLSHGFTQEWT